MPKILDASKIRKIFKGLPEGVKEVMLSPDTADHIGNVCEKYNVPGEKFSLVAKAAGDILMKIAPLSGFTKALETEAGLKEDTAEGIAKEIDFLIFSQVRDFLTAPQQTKTEAPAGAEQEQTPKKPAKPDAYRELIE